MKLRNIVTAIFATTLIIGSGCFLSACGDDDEQVVSGNEDMGQEMEGSYSGIIIKQGITTQYSAKVIVKRINDTQASVTLESKLKVPDFKDVTVNCNGEGGSFWQSDDNSVQIYYSTGIPIQVNHRTEDGSLYICFAERD